MSDSGKKHISRDKKRWSAYWW